MKRNAISGSEDLWRRIYAEPVLAPRAGTWLERAVTTPDLLRWQDRLLFFVGAVRGGHERIAVLHVVPEHLGERGVISSCPIELAVDIGPPGSFDSEHVTDPASVVVDERIFLYYSALGSGPDSIGLAVSKDGYSFEKFPRSVLVGRAPEVVFLKGQFYLLYVRDAPTGGYEIHLAISDDGYKFSPLGARLALSPGLPGTWDSYTVTTPRLFEYKGLFYMLYAGDDRTRDLPHAFGLARSHDLRQWERYPGNPVFRRGSPGTWDDGAIWFGTVFPFGDEFSLWYEGGSQEAVKGKSPILTQVGLAVIMMQDFEQLLALWR